MDELTTDEPDLNILPIVGMGGIDKTTLARNVFDDPYTIHHFDKRIWLTISQEYSSREILMRLLSDREDQVSNETLVELGQRLHKMLFGRRYLIVMDDMWSTGAWNDLKLFFPNIGNGSRVLVTTRLCNVAISLGSHNHYRVDFLDEDKSWNLLCQKTFGQEGCPYPELEEIGKNIAKKCNGLPLAIAVIGGLLANSNMRRDYWETVARNINSFSNLEDDEHCLKILSLSYNNLPIYLKPCFLYMRVFPEDYDIFALRLIKLWVAEGFLKPTPNKSLEDIAKEYLRDLIDRNLILIHSWTYRGKPKRCGIHDLLRDLCLRESQKEYFILVPKVQQLELSQLHRYNRPCLLCGSLFTVQMIDLSEVHVASQSTSFASLPVCNDCKKMYPNLTRLRLVRLKAFNEGDIEFLPPTKLRYLHMNYENESIVISPSAVLLLWNLQALSFGWDICKIVLPHEIWEMPQLRHLIVNQHVVLPDPTITQDSIVMQSLQTFSRIRNFRCTMDIIKRVPNLKKLKICYFGEDRSAEWSYYCLHNIARLPKLETLAFEITDFVSLKNITFPTSLKKLTLIYCSIPWEEMTIIGSLPNLELLQLHNKAVKGPEWSPKGNFFG
ncbi:UNVERIFIED_CONTAM: putative disease resistance RPP13-like protein 3 [Sesamum calycinum]|uniref:Disease resistance RPP13-like protein 3 n=1 Tax=Sesamum calycinum TaxID=2727403 RepID=A0AAW2NG32_9LAMI